MTTFPNELNVITFSDLKRLFFENFSKIKSVSIFCGLICLGFLLLREPHYIAEATFKQTAKNNDTGFNLKETYQQLFSHPFESGTLSVMQSNEVLKNVVEELGLQVQCNCDSIFVKLCRRVRDNLWIELGRPIADLAPFVFCNVSYSKEKSLELFLKLVDANSYQLLDHKKQLISMGKIGERLSFLNSQFTLSQVPQTAKLNTFYPVVIHPWSSAVQSLKKGLKVAPWKQDKAIVKLCFSSRDRFLAADLLNQVMRSYQQYLKKENDEVCQLQLSYLQQRQQELTQHYDDALIDHVAYLKDNLSKSGFVGVSQEIDILSQPKNLYTSKLFDVDLEIERLRGDKDFSAYSLEEENDLGLEESRTPLQPFQISQKGEQRDQLPFLNEKKQLERRLDDCDLDEKRNKEILILPLSLEIEEVREQLREAKSLLQSIEKGEKISSYPFLLKDPKSAIASLIKLMSESTTLIVQPEKSEASITHSPYLRDFIDHLFQKQKVLEENLHLLKRESHDFSGLNLTTAQQILEEYTRERDSLQAQMRELVFLKDHLCQPDFEVSSLGGVFNDPVTTDLVQKASAIALQLKDDNNRSDREQVRLQETLQTQKHFLSHYLFQTIELKKLRAKLLHDKIISLRLAIVRLLRSEKKLLIDKLQELNQKMGDLPEKWRRESLLVLKKELGSMMLHGISQITEAKNLSQHIFQASSKPLDVALPPLKMNPPKILILSFFTSILAGISLLGLLFCKNMLKGFPVTEEALKVSGFPTCGSLSRHCQTNLSELSANDLETLRRIIAFLISQPKKPEAQVTSCLGGKYPNYTFSLAELLAMRGLKVLVITCVFDQVVHTDDMPGLWQYLNQQGADLPLRRHLMFDHLPSGGTTRHAAEFLGSAKFASFLTRMKQKYDMVLLFSSADAAAAEGYALLPVSDSVVVTVYEEKKEELLAYVDWSAKKEFPCVTFAYSSDGS